MRTGLRAGLHFHHEYTITAECGFAGWFSGERLGERPWGLLAGVAVFISGGNAVWVEKSGYSEMADRYCWISLTKRGQYGKSAIMDLYFPGNVALNRSVKRWGATPLELGRL